MAPTADHRIRFRQGDKERVGVAVLGFLVWVWFAIPLSRRVRDESDDV